MINNSKANGDTTVSDDTPTVALNKQQQIVYDAIIDGVASHGKRLFIVEGPTTSGKTHLANTLAEHWRDRGRNVLLTAPTARAAVQLDKGTTVHAAFRMPPERAAAAIIDEAAEATAAALPDNSADSSNPAGMVEASQPQLAEEILRAVDAWICDDAAALTDSMFTSIAERIAEVSGVTDVFGDKIVVCLGDFRQLMPSFISRKFITDDYLSTTFERLELPASAVADAERARYVAQIAALERKATEDALPLATRVENRAELVEFAYGRLESIADYEAHAANILMTPTAVYEHELNLHLLSHVFRLTKSDNAAEAEDIWCLKPQEERFVEGELTDAWPTLRTEMLLLSRGAIARVTETPKGANVAKGLYTGRRVVVDAREGDKLRCRLVEDKIDTLGVPVAVGTARVLIERQEHFAVGPEERRRGGHLAYKQFPLELSFAATIAKCRGLRFDRVGLLLRETSAELDKSSGGAHDGAGALYTVLSAVRGFDRVRVCRETCVPAKRPRLDVAANTASASTSPDETPTS